LRTRDIHTNEHKKNKEQQKKSKKKDSKMMSYRDALRDSGGGQRTSYAQVAAASAPQRCGTLKWVKRA